MSDIRDFGKGLSTVSRLWKQGKYDRALAEVESLLEVWPGNAHLHVQWASLVQLQEDPVHDLSEAKEALQQAVRLDVGSPAAADRTRPLPRQCGGRPAGSFRILCGWHRSCAAATHRWADRPGKGVPAAQSKEGVSSLPCGDTPSHSVSGRLEAAQGRRSWYRPHRRLIHGPSSCVSTQGSVHRTNPRVTKRSRRGTVGITEDSGKVPGTRLE